MRTSVEERYLNDPVFHAMVDMFEGFLMQHTDITPTELREAAMLAAMKVEMRTVRHLRMPYPV
jgi:hypothetical protein